MYISTSTNNFKRLYSHIQICSFLIILIIFLIFILDNELWEILIKRRISYFSVKFKENIEINTVPIFQLHLPFIEVFFGERQARPFGNMSWGDLLLVLWNGTRVADKVLVVHIHCGSTRNLIERLWLRCCYLNLRLRNEPWDGCLDIDWDKPLPYKLCPSWKTQSK